MALAGSTVLSSLRVDGAVVVRRFSAGLAFVFGLFFLVEWDQVEALGYGDAASRRAGRRDHVV